MISRKTDFTLSALVDIKRINSILLKSDDTSKCSAVKIPTIMVDTLYQVPLSNKTLLIGSYTSVADHFVEELLVQ